MERAGATRLARDSGSTEIPAWGTSTTTAVSSRSGASTEKYTRVAIAHRSHPRARARIGSPSAGRARRRAGRSAGASGAGVGRRVGAPDVFVGHVGVDLGGAD